MLLVNDGSDVDVLFGFDVTVASVVVVVVALLLVVVVKGEVDKEDDDVNEWHTVVTPADIVVGVEKMEEADTVVVVESQKRDTRPTAHQQGRLFIKTIYATQQLNNNI